jgi:2,3-bisphosphoglycerate-independent phosphoglycerate mutase
MCRLRKINLYNKILAFCVMEMHYLMKLKGFMPEKVILCILDGFGIGDELYQYNAVFQAKTPNFQRFLKEYPHAMLKTSGEDVGLPDGQMGNSEVGHMTIGAGRVIYQDLPLINKAITDGNLEEKLQKINTTGTVHIVGLCSHGGVHASLTHIKYIYKTLEKHGKNVVLHVITDGRDVPPQSFKSTIDEFDGMRIATVSGRFFAMDRDQKLERTQTFFDAMLGRCEALSTLGGVIKNSYHENITDEFIKPTVISGFEGIKKGDTLLVANFRADRSRQLTSMALQSEMFKEVICMTPYSDDIASKTTVLFPKEFVKNTLVEVLEKHKKRHLHIAETEKYAHVTFFFNGGKEQIGKHEERILVPSPNVKTYDLQPEMSIYELQEKLLHQINSYKHDFIVINIANGDMVGHTGNFEASKQAAEHIDVFLGNLEKTSMESNYHLLITADHGNLEEMIDIKTHDIHTQHTTGAVPLISISQNKVNLKNGTLANIAPTVLRLMDIAPPQEMSEDLL